MNLLYKASVNKLKAEFASNIQPNENRQEFNPDTQIKRCSHGQLSDKDKKELDSYRRYRKSKKQEEKESRTKDLVRYTPLLPERLKKDLSRSKVIKQDDISPTVS